jgi:signal transduction histidine kinase
MPRKPASRSGLDRAIGHIKALSSDDLRSVTEKLCMERGSLDAIMRSLLEGIILIDRWGTIGLINPSAMAMLGIPDVEDGFPAANLWRSSPDLARALGVSGGSLPEIADSLTKEITLHYPSEKIVRLYATPLDTERFLIVLGDITSQKESDSRHLEDVRLEALTQLAAGVAHELGNPLNALQIHLQLLERAVQKEKISPSGRKTLGNSVSIAQGEIKRLDHIIRNFLQAIRHFPANLQPTDAVKILEEVLSVLRAEMESTKVAIKVELPGLVPMIMADEGQLKQVYFNVIKNAKEAMESGGTLIIRAASDAEHLRIEFTDSGKGISQESLRRLFEPYFTTKEHGTGLGLLIAQKIMRAHQGSVEIKSTEHKGTTVSLVFPLKYRRYHPLEAPQSTPRLRG